MTRQSRTRNDEFHTYISLNYYTYYERQR
jgi:hypothetical protein